MAITNAGKDAVMKAIFNEAYLALGNMSEDGRSFVEISTSQSVNPGYARMLIKCDDPPKNDTTYTTLYVKSTDGVLTSLQDAFFKDADDGTTRDSLDPLSEGGWKETISAIGVFLSGTLYYASQFSDTPINVYQAHRVKVGKGKFNITFNPKETSSTSTQSEIVSLNMESKVNLEVEG